MSNEFGNGHGAGNRGGRPDGDGFRKGPRKGGFGDRKGGKPYGDRGDRKPYGDRGDRKGGKPYGDRKPYGERAERKFEYRGERKPFGGKPRGDRRDFGSFDRPQRPRLHVDRGGRPGGRPFDKNAPREPLNGDSELLKETLDRIAGKGFSAYSDLRGTFAFDGYELRINRIQRDPFAPPSKVTVHVDAETAGYPEELYATPQRKEALEDHLLRAFNAALHKRAFNFAEFIKGGAFTCSRPGQEIIKRSACGIVDGAVEVRFEATLPARDRSIATREFEEMFFEALPRIVRDALLYVSHDANELQAVANLADDQQAIRDQLAERKLVAFVANGAILPRETGVSKRPMADAIPFESPASLKVELELPHAGKVAGMGVPQGVTLIVGGGYHGKSTLLQAIQAGVYNHIAGDGRELVICDEGAVKLRAEDGRSVRGTDISLFINNLPNQQDTASFWTEDASGSTSQAASTAEALEAGCKTFLIDEDTCATNFMVRDTLMQQVISGEKEPITPFIERMRDLYEKAGVSTILVAGSSGAFFGVADTIVQMDEYRAIDITAEAKRIASASDAASIARAEGFHAPDGERIIDTPQHRLKVKTASQARKADAERRETGKAQRPEPIKTKVFGGVDVRADNLGADMRFVEQLADGEQANTLAGIVKYCLENDLLARFPLKQAVAQVYKKLQEEGFGLLNGGKTLVCGQAMPRREEVFACLNRLRLRD